MDQLSPTLSPIAPADNIGNISRGNTVEVNPDVDKGANSTTKTIDIDNISPESNKFTVDLFESDIDVDFVKAKPADAKPDADNQNTNYINPGKPQSNPGIPGSMGSTNILKTKEDFRSGVKAALMVVDYVISLVAMKIAGDTRQQAYSADTQQKKLLEDVLVEYLYGKQTQMPMWLTLSFAVAGSYGLILFSAGQKRYQMNQNKKLYAGNKPIQNNNPPIQQRPTQTNKPTISESDMKKYQQINPLGKPVTEKLHTETMYVENKTDGTLEPRQLTGESYSEIIETPTRRSSPEYPDENLTAESASKLREYVDKGIFPMYKRNANGKVIKVKYTSNGMPIMAGKPGKLVKRRS